MAWGRMHCVIQYVLGIKKNKKQNLCTFDFFWKARLFSNLISVCISYMVYFSVYKSLTFPTYNIYNIIFNREGLCNKKKAQLNNLKVMASIRQGDMNMPMSMEVWSSNMMSAQSQFQILNVMEKGKGAL